MLGWALLAALAVSIGVGSWLAASAPQRGVLATSPTSPHETARAEEIPPARFVGGQRCIECHAVEAAQWNGSHHDLAMQRADDKTVLGEFANTRFSYAGVTSTFFRREGKFFVNTDGPDGELHDYEIKYTLGVAPLQQYLIEFPGGRIQALNVVWDTRPREAGGQRWFHLYPKERITSEDPLHWTGMYQNWNYACAECHSTNVEKNYNPLDRSYATTWSDIDVSCEACHGPGSRHVAWAREPELWLQLKDKGLEVLLDERRNVQWLQVPESGNARRSAPRNTHVELQTCAHCHSRRSPLTDRYKFGRSFGDNYHLQLLTDGYYYPDGQIEDEVYVYGSFLQSKMNHAGVTCSDCHDPHSLNLRAPANALCLGCHAARKYDAPKHHFHPLGTAGASCVECHMPARDFMVIDGRRDHSLRVPRPDLSAKFGTPNACNKCHTDKSPQWASDAVQDWHGKTPAGFQTYTEAFHAARTGHPAAGSLLADLVRDAGAPAIARATAMLELGRYLSPENAGVLQLGANSSDPLLRAAVADALAGLGPELRLALGAPLLDDRVRDVRIAAARALAAVPAAMMDAAQRRALDAAIAEFVDVQDANAERPEAHTALGTLYAQRGRFHEAESEFRKAIGLQPYFVAAHVNLADLYRAQGQEARGEAVLHDALKLLPDDASLHFALGLLFVREKNYPQAEKALQVAARQAPDNAHYSYVYAVALHGLDKPEGALRVLESALERHPHNRELMFGLTVFNRDQGNWQRAQSYAEKLVALAPRDPQLKALLAELRRQRSEAGPRFQSQPR